MGRYIGRRPGRATETETETATEIEPGAKKKNEKDIMSICLLYETTLSRRVVAIGIDTTAADGGFKTAVAQPLPKQPGAAIGPTCSGAMTRKQVHTRNKYMFWILTPMRIQNYSGRRALR